jgi:hypothetical protein
MEFILLTQCGRAVLMGDEFELVRVVSGLRKKTT